ncbi:pantetheine-phosphate adenylyltransferase [Candidatus Acetothermia bacterium]|nr:MAG: pantetheine-phosphate adenylyltransferase [Candidatus Acetothermia bacterium]HHK66790.1 pantetheine-phosphate adenylyltransferase [Candidatus Acetothermia bacterium]
MTITSAIYPGSFDPITYGHIDIVRRAKKLFPRLLIAIVANPNKSTLFTIEERMKITEAALAEVGLDGIQVISYAGLLVNCAKEHGVSAIVRGLRANSDFDYEFQMALTNRDLAPQFESVFFMTAGTYSFLSSSIVKEVCSYGGDVSAFVPESVKKALEEKLAEKRAERSSAGE